MHDSRRKTAGRKAERRKTKGHKTEGRKAEGRKADGHTMAACKSDEWVLEARTDWTCMT